MVDKKTTKTAKSKAAPKTTPQKAEAQKSQTPPPGLKLKRSYLVLIVIIASAVVLLYILKGLFIAAMVNGHPVSRIAVIKTLEEQYGQQALQAEITKTLLLQEANKRGVTVSDKEITDEIKKIEDFYKQQGQTLDQVLKLRSASRDLLVEQIRLKKLLDKMIGKVTVSDKEVNDYMTQNQEALGDVSKEMVKQQLEQQKLEGKEREFIENLQKNAKINYFVSY